MLVDWNVTHGRHRGSDKISKTKKCTMESQGNIPLPMLDGPPSLCLLSPGRNVESLLYDLCVTGSSE